MGKLMPRQRQQVLGLLRTGQYSSKDIADRTGLSPQVVMGVKSNFTRGKYGDSPRVVPSRQVELCDAWTYLLMSPKGEVYLGATMNLRRRLHEHNSHGNSGWTKGRRWHLLAAQLFASREEAFAYEHLLKKSRYLKADWKVACVTRAKLIVERFGYSFDPTDWNKKTSRRLEVAKFNHVHENDGILCWNSTGSMQLLPAQF